MAGTRATDRRMIKPAIWLVAAFAAIVILALFVRGDGGQQTPVVATGTVTAAPGTGNPAYPTADATSPAQPPAQALNQNPAIETQGPVGERGQGSQKGVEETDS